MPKLRPADAVAALKSVMRLKPGCAKDFHLVAEFALLKDAVKFQTFRKDMFQRVSP